MLSAVQRLRPRTMSIVTPKSRHGQCTSQLSPIPSLRASLARRRHASTNGTLSLPAVNTIHLVSNGDSATQPKPSRPAVDCSMITTAGNTHDYTSPGGGPKRNQSEETTVPENDSVEKEPSAENTLEANMQKAEKSEAEKKKAEAKRVADLENSEKKLIAALEKAERKRMEGLQKAERKKTSDQEKAEKKRMKDQEKAGNKHDTEKDGAARRKVVLPPKNIEAHLDAVAKASDFLTISDIERYKPVSKPDELSPEYSKKYNDTMTALLRSFTLRQLEHFVFLYELPMPPRSSRNRRAVCASYILEKKWGWVPASIIEEQQKNENEMIDTKIRLSPSEASLLLGQDGSRLQMTSERYDVKLHLNKEQTHLRIIGRLGSYKLFQGYLNNLRNSIVTEMLDLPPLVRLEEKATGAISRITGVFMNNQDGKLLISSLKNERQSAERAKHLVFQALAEVQKSAMHGIILPGSTSQYSNHEIPVPYSLFPFTAHQSASAKGTAGSAFRLRRIGHWLDTIHPVEGSSIAGLVRQASTSILGEGRGTDLYSCMTNSLSRGAVGDLTISATSGYFLFLTPASERHSIRPPLHGQLTIKDILGRSSRSPDATSFQPCAPIIPELTARLSESEPIRKLVYLLAQPASDSKQENETLVFDIKVTPSGEELDGNNWPACYIQREFIVDISIPDRPLDIQMSAKSKEDVNSSEWTQEIHSIARVLNGSDTNSSIPLTLSFRDKTYSFQSSSTIHRQDHRMDSETDEIAVVEKIIDDDSGQINNVCKIVCKDHHTDSGWGAFLQRCDNLTATT